MCLGQSNCINEDKINDKTRLLVYMCYISTDTSLLWRRYNTIIAWNNTFINPHSRHTHVT